MWNRLKKSGYAFCITLIFLGTIAGCGYLLRLLPKGNFFNSIGYIMTYAIEELAWTIFYGNILLAILLLAAIPAVIIMFQDD